MQTYPAVFEEHAVQEDCPSREYELEAQAAMSADGIHWESTSLSISSNVQTGKRQSLPASKDIYLGEQTGMQSQQGKGYMRLLLTRYNSLREMIDRLIHWLSWYDHCKLLQYTLAWCHYPYHS